MNYYYKSHYTDVNVKPLYLAKLPIPDLDEKEMEIFSSFVDVMISSNKELEKLSSILFLFKSTLNINPNTKLLKWY